MRGQATTDWLRRRRRARKRLGRIGALSVALTAALVAAPNSVASPAFSVRKVRDISSSCAGQNAEVEQAVDPSLHFVYEDWMGCTGIAFAVSTDGGLHFNAPISLPGTVGSNTNVWDPAVTVAPDGTVYASVMRAKGGDWYPVVAASFDHGKTFPQISSLVPPAHKNWGDRDFIAVGPNGTVYVTWDYGPERTSVTYICTTGGSCAFATGDLNVVIQKSTDGGKTWSPIIPVSPGFPASGGDSAPLVVEPSGRIDVLYQGYHITSTTTYAMTPAHSYFTSSNDGGQTWSTPVLVGADHPELTMSLSEWWIDGAIAMDSAGNLCDLGHAGSEPGHRLAVLLHRSRRALLEPRARHSGCGQRHAHRGSRRGRRRSRVRRVAHERVIKGLLRVPARVFDLGRLADAPHRVSGNRYGAPPVWPGDTFGISTLPGSRVVVTWGSGVSISGKAKPEIFAATARF